MCSCFATGLRAPTFSGIPWGFRFRKKLQNATFCVSCYPPGFADSNLPFLTRFWEKQCPRGFQLPRFWGVAGLRKIGSFQPFRISPENGKSSNTTAFSSPDFGVPHKTHRRKILCVKINFPKNGRYSIRAPSGFPDFGEPLFMRFFSLTRFL